VYEGRIRNKKYGNLQLEMSRKIQKTLSIELLRNCIVKLFLLYLFILSVSHSLLKQIIEEDEYFT
jgi:hypothetical protein